MFNLQIHPLCRTPCVEIMTFTMVLLCSCEKGPSRETAAAASTPQRTSTNSSVRTESPPPTATESTPSIPLDAPVVQLDNDRPQVPAKEAQEKPGLSPNEAANPLPLSLYLANQHRHIGRQQKFRVTAESGTYFNCYYRGRKQSYHHVRLRGDGSAYLDGYLPRDAAGERLFTELLKRPRQLTVTVVTREATMSDVCTGQVEILDFERGFDFDTLGVGVVGSLGRRIANQKSRDPARNRPRIAHYLDRRQAYTDSPRTFRVRARLDRYFQCKYANEQKRYYAVFLQGDDYKGLRGYLPRSREADSFVQWLASNEGAKVTTTVTVPAARFDETCPDQVEITSWQKGWQKSR